MTAEQRVRISANALGISAADFTYDGFPVARTLPSAPISSDERGFKTIGNVARVAYETASSVVTSVSLRGTAMPSDLASAVVWVLSNARRTTSCAGSAN